MRIELNRIKWKREGKWDKWRIERRDRENEEE